MRFSFPVLFYTTLSLGLFTSCARKAIPKSIQTLEEVVIVERSTSGDYKLTFNQKGEWEIYSGTAQDQIDWKNPLRTVVGTSTTIARSVNEPRLYFGIITPKNYVVIASERQIKLTETPNFRDIGGIMTKDRRMVKWGEIYRSGSLNHLESVDHQRLKNLNIQTVCDFRNNVETDKKPNNLPAEIDYFQYAIGGEEGAAYEDLVRRVKEDKLRGKEINDLFVDIMASFTDTAATDFKPVVDNLLDDRAPLVYHCAGGKDRTGFMTAILLSAMNVDRKTIKKEYLLSNYYREEFNRSRARLAKLAVIKFDFYDNETIRYGLMVHDAYLDVVFKTIDKKFGGMDKYLEEKFGLDQVKRQQLIDRYTMELPIFNKKTEMVEQKEITE